MQSNNAYTKEMTDAYFRRIDDKLDDLILHQKEVKEEVKRTNGRVKSLEVWKATIIGALGILTALVLPIFMALALDLFRSVH